VKEILCLIPQCYAADPARGLSKLGSMALRTVSWALRWLAFSALIVCLSGCASPGYAFHSFSFGDRGENQGVEIIDYQYGSSGVLFTRPEPLNGRVPQNGGTTGNMPVGEFLYVKWREAGSDAVREKRVELKSRLPRDMNHKRLHFLIDNSQLHVYVVSERLRSPTSSPCPLRTYRIFQCEELYPSEFRNF
jgi:hypothetical protein